MNSFWRKRDSFYVILKRKSVSAGIRTPDPWIRKRTPYYEIRDAWNSSIINGYVTKILYKVYGVKLRAGKAQVRNHKMARFRTKSALCPNY